MNAQRPAVIAIDGPSGSGKSSLSRALAAEFTLAYLDTGAMYRAAAVWCLRQGLDLADGPTVAAAVQAMPLTIGLDPVEAEILLGTVSVAREIRSSQVATVVSQVSSNLAVREELIDRQRHIIDTVSEPYRGIVAEGRDITTVVAPDADVRILLTAAEETRLARRALENTGRLDAETLAATRDQVIRRDQDDSAVTSFRAAADGVVTIDTTTLDFAASLAAVRAVVLTARPDLDINASSLPTVPQAPTVSS